MAPGQYLYRRHSIAMGIEAETSGVIPRTSLSVMPGQQLTRRPARASRLSPKNDAPAHYPTPAPRFAGWRGMNRTGTRPQQGAEPMQRLDICCRTSPTVPPLCKWITG